MNWKLWKRGPILRVLDSVSPLLASWDKSTHPSQVNLRAYVHDVVARLSPLPQDVPLFLHMNVDVKDPIRLSRHHDLENYLTPLFGRRYLPPERFVLVTANKFVGGGSQIVCGVANSTSESESNGWEYFALNAGSGASLSSWKQNIHDVLSAQNSTKLPSGPVRVRLAFSCSTRRNWTTLWKPTGDAMGPVLGLAHPGQPFNPSDDRIVDLQLHLNIKNELQNNVEVGMWWRTN
ncbi:MAG: hypothetical protein WEB58_09705 [Planctomycetaceae bacterium]